MSLDLPTPVWAVVQAGPPPDLFVVGGAVLSLLCLYAAMRVTARKRLIENLPTSRTLGAFIGSYPVYHVKTRHRMCETEY